MNFKQKIKIRIIGISCTFYLRKLHDIYILHQFSSGHNRTPKVSSLINTRLNLKTSFVREREREREKEGAQYIYIMGHSKAKKLMITNLLKVIYVNTKLSWKPRYMTNFNQRGEILKTLNFHHDAET